jgi:hypothetical protein
LLERAAIRRYAAFLVAATAVRAYEPSPFWATKLRAGLASAWAAIRRSCGEVVPTSCGLPAAVVDNVGIAQGQGMPQIDQALEAVVGAIDALTEPQDGGPGVVLTLGGLVVSGTIIPAWQWFHEVEHSARAAFVVHVGGSIDDEHGGWARLFKGTAEAVARDHAERRAALQASEGLPDRYRRLMAQQDQTVYIHLTEARVVAAGVSPLPAAGMHWRGRLSEIAGWSFGHLGVEPPTAPAQDADHYM